MPARLICYAKSGAIAIAFGQRGPDDPVDVIDLEKIANLRGYRGKQFRERPIAFWLAGDQYQELLWDLRERTGEFGH